MPRPVMMRCDGWPKCGYGKIECSHADKHLSTVCLRYFFKCKFAKSPAKGICHPVKKESHAKCKADN